LGSLVNLDIINNKSYNSQAKGRLIKFNYCVQNIIENQIYLAVGQTKENKLFTNKYHEFNLKSKNNKEKHNTENDQNIMDIEEEQPDYDDYGCGSDFNNTILSERLLINGIPIPYLTKWVSEKYNLETEDVIKNKKILIYEYENQIFKVNDQRLSVGVAYNYTDCIVIHNWFSIDNFLISEIPKSIFLKDEDFKIARERLFEFLNSMFNDRLFSDYLILCLTSQILGKVGTKLLGKLSLNLLNGISKNTIVNQENISAININSIASTNFTIKDALKTILNNITLFYLDLKISIKDLNEQLLVSKFDIETEELNQGILQMMKNTLLLIDEVEMQEGKLGINGLTNVAALKNIIEYQMLHYEFPYSKVEIPQECKIIAISENKSLFKSPSLIEVNIITLFILILKIF